MTHYLSDAFNKRLVLMNDFASFVKGGTNESV